MPQKERGCPTCGQRVVVKPEHDPELGGLTGTQYYVGLDAAGVKRLMPVVEAAKRWRERTDLGNYAVRCDPGTVGEALQDLLAAVDALGTKQAVSG